MIQKRLWAGMLMVGLVALSSVTGTAAALDRRAPGQASRQSDGPNITSAAAGVEIGWTDSTAARVQSAAAAQSAWAGWPRVQIGDRVLPGRIQAFWMDAAAPSAAAIAALGSGDQQPSEALPQDVADAFPLVMPSIPTDEFGVPRPDQAYRPSRALPKGPVSVVREGVYRGRRMIVLALTPVFERDGAARAVSSLKVSLPGLRMAAGLDDSAADQSAASPAQAAAITAVDAGSAVYDPYALASQSGNVWTVKVSSPGLQRVMLAQLSGVASWTNVHVYINGGELDAHVVGNELIFYAPYAGDRYNATTTYWIAANALPAPRMFVDSSVPTGSASTYALERGVWRDISFYDSTLAGYDGDHFFSVYTQTGSSFGLPDRFLDIPLTTVLPVAVGTTRVTITGAAVSENDHTVDVTIGGATKTLAWSGAGTFPTAARNTTADIASVAATAQLRQYNTAPDTLQYDTVQYDRPVLLTLNGAGASFMSRTDGDFVYQATGLPKAGDGNAYLYDVTDPLHARVYTTSGASLTFAGARSRSFVVRGSGTLFDPVVAAHAPVALVTEKQGLYIAPQELMGELAALVAFRNSQGLPSAAVQAEGLYDAFGYGQMSPGAIRNYLRWAIATWTTKPASVILVGDATRDPRRYVTSSLKVVNLIPAYLMPVDSYRVTQGSGELGETACESCYAQLDGDSPLADKIPDLVFGRLPVKNAPELKDIVAKLIKYDSDTSGFQPGSWRARSVWLTDNFQEANGSYDPAGNFYAFAEEGIALQPKGAEIARMYYMPCGLSLPLSNPCEPRAQGSESDSLRASQATFQQINSGAGLINYNGHANETQIARTDLTKPVPWLFYLFDVDRLSNTGRMPIILEMACLTSEFQYNTSEGTSLDERLFLRVNKDTNGAVTGGGAIAVWGSTGFGVAAGHTYLQKGFYQSLWGNPMGSKSIGQLTQAGFASLIAEGGGQDVELRTFALLGDPQTKPRLTTTGRKAFLPIIRR